MRIFSIRFLTLVVSYALLSACATQPRVEPMLSQPSPESSKASIYQQQQSAGVSYDAALERLQRTASENPEDMTAHLHLGVLYRQAEKFDQAERALSRARVLSNNAPEVLNEIGILQRSLGQFELARQTYLDILQTSPDFADAHFNLGVLYDLYLRDPASAHAHYQAYLNNALEADKRVEKWLVDLQRRHGIDATTSLVNVND